MSRKVQNAPTHVWQVVRGSPSDDLSPSYKRDWLLKDSLSAAFQVIEAEAASSLRLCAPNLTECQFCHLLSVKTSHKFSLDSKGRKTDSTS